MFQHKVVIVTDGAQGIGRSIAQKYVEQGANVVIADVAEPANTNIHFMKQTV